MNKELIERVRSYEADHTPDGWPAIRMRDISALANALDTADQQVEALSRELLTPQVFTRLVEWLREPKPATAAFTAGIERQIAYALEMDVLPEVKSLRIRLANRDARIAELEKESAFFANQVDSSIAEMGEKLDEADRKLAIAREAMSNLVKVKGRHHTEQVYSRVVDALAQIGSE